MLMRRLHCPAVPVWCLYETQKPRFQSANSNEPITAVKYEKFDYCASILKEEKTPDLLIWTVAPLGLTPPLRDQGVVRLFCFIYYANQQYGGNLVNYSTV